MRLGCNAQYIYNLIAQGEHVRQDFKYEISDARKIARSVSAFANTEGGRLLVGVNDNGKIAGVRSEEEIYMIEAAARLGAIAAGSTEEQEEAAAAYARKIGLAFQIRDDVLDVLGDEAELGKPIGSDQENQKSTFVGLKGAEGCQALIRTLTEEAVGCIRPYPGSEFLCDLAAMLAGRTK